jgi:O-antigen ligase
MSASSGQNNLLRLSRVLWAATLATVPITSFRYIPAGEGTYVRPLAVVPLVVLLLIQAVRTFRREIEWPRAAALVPLAAFLMVAAVASMAGILLAPIPMRGQEAVERILRAWITVLVGIGFFIGAVWMNRDEAGVRFSVKWLLIGFMADVLWSGLQAATFYLEILPKPLVTEWQRLFSLRELIRTNRISGMAYEPSWLAGQIATVYLPWLLAAVITGVRVFRLRWLEPVLLVSAVLMVLATYSRGGFLTLCISAGLVLVLAARPELRSTWERFHVRTSGPRVLVWRAGVAVLALLAVAGVGLWLAQKGYVSRLWESRAENPADFLVQNSAGARGAYLAGALSIYADHPWTGVGLGASGLYMYSRLPDWALTTVPEIARQLSPESQLYPNPKNLYARLLAETGLLGFIFFLPFLLLLLAEALQALRRGSPWWRYVGMAGFCSWLAVLLYNLTQDSFATPNLWLNLGILAGASHAAVRPGRKAVEGATQRRPRTRRATPSSRGSA